MNNKPDFFLMILSLLIPLVGLVLFLMSLNGNERELSFTYLLCTIGGMMGWLVIFINIFM